MSRMNKTPTGLNISDFDILLADVEGKEYELLKGGKNKITKYKPIIIMENV